jgi:hypothetical protein
MRFAQREKKEAGTTSGANVPQVFQNGIPHLGG